MCMPLLYQDAHLQSSGWDSCLQFFEALSAHPNMVRDLYIGRGVVFCRPMPQTIFKDFDAALEKCLQSQRELETVYFNHHEDSALHNLFSEPTGQRILNSLHEYAKKLHAVSLVNSEGTSFGFKNKIPAFSNLRKLELVGMKQRGHDRVSEVAEILISCPGLLDLSLSTTGAGADGEVLDLLPKVVEKVKGKIEKRLRLRSLRLGYGFLPVESEGIDYLSEVVDLTNLDNLRLDNDHIGVKEVLDDAPIDVKQFASAYNVSFLTAERLSPDIVELIHVLNTHGQLTRLSLPRFCDTQPRVRMDRDNQYWDDYWYDEFPGEIPSWSAGQLFSAPLEQAGTHWKSILIGDIFLFNGPQGPIFDCLTRYERLEELALPMSYELWPRFQSEVMPHLRQLQRLFLVGHTLACGYVYQGKVLGYEDYVGLSYGHYSSGTEKELEEKVKQGEAEHSIHVYKWLRGIFMDNRTSIADGDNRALLRYLGLQGMVFTCMLLPGTTPGGNNSFLVNENGKEWIYDIVDVDEDDAARFEAIREWNEGTARLRAGGDEDPSRNSH
ncbi:uncharacterized protein M437DRAFT_63678 [Aureobasidium melanogenum CBS 110374]|uniref:Uncharacterized protein n=1 Tax=Aureobasidium melanogenum (strain CBS 110374) TaxID=1043003 RepID=A0A074VX34_AURM1|nr:uncharacterized protein M437DRAFT_63678 [Aureobasidium melanogenum CBS 110374]KEQ65018.1 hypothetical protein M437DRAFT_63678 [Aureobasidium melanogenum CBS 110374]